MPVFNDNFDIDNARLPSDYVNPAVGVQDTLEKFWTSRDYSTPPSNFSSIGEMHGLGGSLPSYLIPVTSGVGDADPDQLKSYLSNSGQSADANAWMVEGESPIGMKIDFNSVYQMLSDGTYHRKQKDVINPATDHFRFAAQQTNGEKWMNGLAKMWSNASNVFAQGVVGGIYGIGSAIVNGSSDKIWDNDVTNYFNDRMTVANLENQIWRDPNAKGGLASLGTVDFWADDFLSGIGFMAGAVGTEALFALTPVKGMSLASLGARGANLARGVATGASAARNLRTVASAAKAAKAFGAVKNVARLGDMGSILRMTATSTAAESSFEALQFRNDAVDKFFTDYKHSNNGELPTEQEVAEFNKSLNEAGNAVFAGNMLVTGLSNYLMFGKHLMGPGIRNAIDNTTGAFTPSVFKRFMGVSADKEFAKGASKAVKESTESAVKHLAGTSGKEVFRMGTKAKIADFVLTAGGKAMTEGLQEVTQGTLAKMGQEWLDSRYDPEYVGRALSFAEAGSKALSEHYGTDDFWREFLAGAVVGVIGGKASDMALGGQKLFEGEYGKQNRRLVKLYDDFVKNGGENITKFSSIVQKYGSEQFDKLGARIVSTGHMAKAYDKADDKLAKGDLIGSHLDNAEAMFMFNFMSSMEQLGGSMGFSSKDMFHSQIDLLSAETFKKQYGLDEGQILEVKNRMKRDFDKMESRYEKAMSTARDVLRMADPKLSSLQLPLAVNLYKAGALTEVMQNISSELGNFIGDPNVSFESMLMLGEDLQNVMDELDAYQKEKDALEAEKDQLEAELPKIDTSDKLDEVENQDSQKRRLDILDRLAFIEASLKDLDNKKYDLEVRINEVRDVDSNIISIMDDSLGLRDSGLNLRVEDLLGTFSSLAKLDNMANELLMSDNLQNKQKGAYLKSLLKTYGEGLKTAQDINHIYTTFASPQNTSSVSNILRAFGQYTDGTVYENDADSAMMDNIIEAEGKRYGVDTKKATPETKNIAKAILRSLVDKHSLREGRLQGEVYVTEDGRDAWMPNRPYAYLREEGDPITQDEMEYFYKNGLYVLDENGNLTTEVRPELKHVHDLLVHRDAHGIPLSRNQKLILDYLDNQDPDSKDSFEATVLRYMKGKYEIDFTTPENNTAFDVGVENRQRRDNALTPREQGEEITPDYLRRKVNNRLQNLRGFDGWKTSEAKELVKELTDEIIKTYLDLKSRVGSLTQDEQNHLDSIEDKLRRISLLQGTQTEDESNLLEDLLLWNQLEELALSTGSANGIIDPDDVETGVNHFDRNLRKGSGNRHYNILQNYSHVFVEGREVNDTDMVAVSNITLRGLVDAMGSANVFINAGATQISPSDLDSMSIDDINNNNVVVQILDRGGNPTFIPVQLDKHGTILFEDIYVDSIQTTTALRLDVQSGSATRYNAVRVADSNGNLKHLESDITVDSLHNGKVINYRMDQTAVSEVKPGDTLKLVYPVNNIYNNGLDTNDTNTFNSQSVIMVYDSQNRFVGVLKSYDGSTFDGHDYYDLRKAAIEAGLNSTTEIEAGLMDTGLTITADFIFTGHPDIMFKEDSSGNITAVDKPFDATVLDRVDGVGYIERDVVDGELYIVTENGRVLYENGKHPYLQNIVSKNGGTKIIPFMVIKQNNVPVLYPLGLKPAQVNVNGQVVSILNDTSLNNGEKARALNALFHSYGIDSSEVVFDVSRVTDAEYIKDAIAKAGLTDIYPDVREWFNGARTKDEILLNDAMTSLDIWDRGFNAPKIRFALGTSTAPTTPGAPTTPTTPNTPSGNTGTSNPKPRPNSPKKPKGNSGGNTSNKLSVDVFGLFGNNVFNGIPDALEKFINDDKNLKALYEKVHAELSAFNLFRSNASKMFRMSINATDASDIKNLVNFAENFQTLSEEHFNQAQKAYEQLLDTVESEVRKEIANIENVINTQTDASTISLLETRVQQYTTFVNEARTARMELSKLNFKNYSKSGEATIRLASELKAFETLLNSGKEITKKTADEVKRNIKNALGIIFEEEVNAKTLKKGDINAWYSTLTSHIKPFKPKPSKPKGNNSDVLLDPEKFDVTNPPAIDGVRLDGLTKYQDAVQRVNEARENVKNIYNEYKKDKTNPKLRLQLRLAAKDVFDSYMVALNIYKTALQVANTEASKKALVELNNIIDAEDAVKSTLDTYMDYISADNPLVPTVYAQLASLKAKLDENPSKELEDRVKALEEDLAHIENLIDGYLMDKKFGITRFKKPSFDTDYKFKEYKPTIEEEEDVEETPEEEDVSDENDINPETDGFKIPALKAFMTRLLNNKLARGLKWFTGPVEISPDADYHIVGKEGIGRLSNYDKKFYEVATAGYNMALRMEYEMWNNGVTEKQELEIKRKTGWERGMDGKWRYEIPDFVFSRQALSVIKSDEENVKFVIEKNATTPVFEFQDLLIEMYPEIEGYEVLFRDIRGASFSRNGRAITIGNHYRRGSDLFELQATLIHEMQHFIQYEENFLRGGNPDAIRVKKGTRKPFRLTDAKDREVLKHFDNFRKDFINRNNIKKDSLEHLVLSNYKIEKQRDYIAVLKKIDVKEDKVQELEDVMYGSVIKSFKKGWETIVYDRYKQYLIYEELQETKKNLKEHKDTLRPDQIKFLKMQIAKKENELYYFRLAGEIEARNASYRRLLTEDERAKTLIKSTQSISSEGALTPFEAVGMETYSISDRYNFLVEIDHKFVEESIKQDPDFGTSIPSFDGPVDDSSTDEGVQNPPITISPDTLGYVKDGVVYLNREFLNIQNMEGMLNAAETAIHEYGHVWLNLIETQAVGLFEEGVRLAKEHPLFEEIKNDPNYAHFNGNEVRIAKEVLATLIGEEARGKAKMYGIGEKLYKWIRSLWNAVRNMISMGEYRALSIDEFKHLAIGDILSEYPVDVSRYSLYRNPDNGDNTIVNEDGSQAIKVDSDTANLFDEVVSNIETFEDFTETRSVTTPQDIVYENYKELQSQYSSATDDFFVAPDEQLRNNALNELNRIGSELNISEISMRLRLPIVPAVQEGFDISERIC